jgi:plasmid stabilization system protein ParE
MASKVVWSGRAERDLENLHDYIAKDKPAAATRYVKALRTACRRLVDYPQSGRVFDKTYRVIVYRNHLVFHRYDAARKIVIVVRVVDGRRDLSGGIDQLGL